MSRSLLRQQTSTEQALRDELATKLCAVIATARHGTPLDLVTAIRSLRMDLDDVEITAGTIARRDHGISARALAEATGIAERNAAKRWPTKEEKS